MSRRLLPLVFGLVLALVFVTAAARGDDYEERRKADRCQCHRGQASWDYLRAPLAPPEDDPHCGLLLSGGSCRTRPRPKGTGADCWGSQREACFWKRHAFSWSIDCPLCADDTTCTACPDLLPAASAEHRQAPLRVRLTEERKVLGPRTVVARSPHFYVVTNTDGDIKLTTQRDTKRLMSAHEVLHLYLQRAELAYADFMHWFGGDVNLHKPMAIYVVDEEDDRKHVGATYFGGAGIHMNYAFAYNDRIAQGYSGNGFVVGQQHERNDTRMHGFLRHQIGHILFSCWQVHGGFEEECPRWAWVGAAHFLEKLHPLHRDFATFCYGEGAGGEGPEKDWPKRVRKLATRKVEPIETYFNKTSLSAMQYDDHLRSWSLMDLMLREDRDRWLKTLARLRTREHEGKAMQTELGIKPDELHDRWIARLTGKRGTMGDVRADAGTDPGVSRRERNRLGDTQDPEELAGLIRGLDRVADVETLETVVDRLDHANDLVRESIHLVLVRTSDPALRAFLREQALYHARPLVRAGVLRVLGALGDVEARERVEALLEDRHALVRANAAEALARFGSDAARPALLAALDERDAKAWIALADAFASFPGRSDEASVLLATRLNHDRWQVRLTATRALASVGTALAVDALIERFERESGRLVKDTHAALRAITGDDLGPRPATWRTWWEEQKAKHDGRPPPPEPKAEPDGRYADDSRPGPDDPHYYGRRIFSKSVCFVLDTSLSMDLNMKVRPEDVAALGDVPAEGTRDAIAKQALTEALGRLAKRTRVRLVFFGTDVRLWKKEFVPIGANLDSAHTAIRLARPAGETNFHGALKAALGLHEKSTTDPALEDIPDTVYFLTDGRPTRGEITAMPELTSWFANLNRFAKIELYVIALGDLGVDLPRLEELAQAGSGQVIHVRER